MNLFHLEATWKGVVLHLELHLVGLGKQGHHGRLVAGTADVAAVDKEDPVAHAQLASSSSCSAGNDLKKISNL